MGVGVGVGVRWEASVHVGPRVEEILNNSGGGGGAKPISLQ